MIHDIFIVVFLIMFIISITILLYGLYLFALLGHAHYKAMLRASKYYKGDQASHLLSDTRHPHSATDNQHSDNLLNDTRPSNKSTE